MDQENVVYTNNGISFSHKKGRNLAICDNTDGPRGYYAKLNKSDRKWQVLYNFTYVWNLKNKTNEQT